MAESTPSESTVIEALDQRLAQSRRAVARRHHKLLGSVQQTVLQAARETRQATAEYVGFWAGEGARWRAFADRQSKAMSTPEVKRVVWQGVQLALGVLQTEVDRRLAALDQPCLGASGGPDAEDAPLPNYDEMNARLIVAAVKKLDAGACREVERYEAAHKNRTTVLRAVRRRLAA